MFTQAVQWFNSRGTVAPVQKPGCDIIANQAKADKADKAVVTALSTVAKWVAQLLGPALAVPEPELLPLSPSSEVEVLPAWRLTKQRTKQSQVQVNTEDLLQAQILGEIAAVRPTLGWGKRVRINSRK
jgi:hypothetical protein